MAGRQESSLKENSQILERTQDAKSRSKSILTCKKEQNLKHCNCTYSCSKKGICCDCLRSHLQARELPACCFPADVEKIYDRSFEKFVELVNEGRV